MKSLILAAALALPGLAQAEKCASASWYQSGTKTASGERFVPSGLTAAHRTLPFGTKLKVTHKGKSVVVTVNDRGPFVKGRTLDLSRGAAKKLGMIDKGVAKVCYRKV
jgi:rare lipoprotein A